MFFDTDDNIDEQSIGENMPAPMPERELYADEDPQAQEQAEMLLEPKVLAEDDNKVRPYGSLRLRYRATEDDHFWGDGGSRFGFHGRTRVTDDGRFFGRVEAGVNILDELDTLLDRSSRSSGG